MTLDGYPTIRQNWSATLYKVLPELAVGSSAGGGTQGLSCSVFDIL